MRKNINEKKAENLKIQEQKKYLHQLLLDTQLLFNLARSSLEDSYQRDTIEQIMFELSSFMRILDENREYSIEQVTLLATRINEVTNLYSKITNERDVLELAKNKLEDVANSELGKMYQGKNPLQMLNVEFEVKPDFVMRMKDLGTVCQKIEADLSLLKQHSPGYKYGNSEAIAHACKKAAHAVYSFFNLGILLAKEFKYYGNRALIITKFKVATPADTIEKDERRKRILQEELRQIDARLIGANLQINETHQQSRSAIFNKKFKKEPPSYTKAKLLSENQQHLLNKVLSKVNELSALSMACLEKDSDEHRKLQALQIELSAFNKILEKDQAFTDEQLEALVSIVNKNTKTFKNIKTTQDVINVAQRKVAENTNRVLAKMNKGEPPIVNQTINFQLAPDFTKQMIAIANCARDLETNVNAMQKAFPARQYSLYDKFANTALSAKRALSSFFKLGMTLASEVQYYGKRALIVSGFKVGTPQDNIERLARGQAFLQEQARQIEAEKRGTLKQMEEQQQKHTKERSKIFKG